MTRKRAINSLSKLVQKNIENLNKPIELNENKQPVKTQKERDRENQRYVKCICYGLDVLKTVTLRILSLEESEQVQLIMDIFPAIIKTCCQSCE